MAAFPAHQRVEVRVPATSANLGPGFDCLGLALDLHSTFVVEVLSDASGAGASGLADPEIHIHAVWGDDPSFATLPTDAHNLMYQALATRLRALGHHVPPLRISAMLGVPAGRGLGSSGMAIVAGLLAADALAGVPDDRQALLELAIELERGHHADNVAACLLGGLVVVARDTQGNAWRAIPAA